MKKMPIAVLGGIDLQRLTLACTVGAGLGMTTAHAAPANDNFADAIELVGDTGNRTGLDNTIDATPEATEPAFAYPGADFEKSVWFKWTCAADGNFQFQTTGSSNSAPTEWDAVVSIYEGATLEELNELQFSDDGQDESVVQAVLAGTTYYIRLTWGGGPTGTAVTERDATNLNLNWEWVTTPPTGVVVDISTIDTPGPQGPPEGIVIDDTVGPGNTGRLIGSTQTFWGSGGFSVPLDLNENTLIIDSGGGNPMNASGPISGNGVVRLQGPAIRVMGNVGNTYTGETFVTSSASLEKSSGNSLQGTPITMNPSSNLAWTANDQIEDTSNVTLATGAVINLDGNTETIGELRLVTGSQVQTGTGGVLKVTKLFINDDEQPEVAYVAGDGYVLGSGYIEVGASGPPVILTPPAVPATPAPDDLATDVHPANLPKLNWADSSLATSYDVYLWLASEPKPGVPNANVALSEYSVSPQVLSLETYKWQVVAKNVQGDTPGPEWTFDTVDRTLVAGNFSSGYSEFTHSLNYIVGPGGSATLLGNFRVHWSGGLGSFSVPVDTDGFILDADTGGGNGGHNASGPISGAGSLVITHGPHYSGLWNNLYTISGTTDNTYSGGTVIKRGQVLLDKTDGIDALPATPITLGSPGNTARLVWGDNNQIDDLAEITVELPTVADGATADANMNYLDLAGYSETIASLELPDDGTKTQVRTGAGGVLTVASLMVNGAPLTGGPYTSGNSSFVTGGGSVVVGGGGGGSAFDTWAAGKGLVEGDAGFDADPDGDGIKNGLEFILGGEPNPNNPGSNSNALLPTGDVDGTNFVFTFTLMNDAAYLNPTVEFDTDLQDPWTTAVDPDNATILINPGDPSATVEVTIPMGSNTEMFARLNAVEP